MALARHGTPFKLYVCLRYMYARLVGSGIVYVSGAWTPRILCVLRTLFPRDVAELHVLVVTKPSPPYIYHTIPYHTLCGPVAELHVLASNKAIPPLCGPVMLTTFSPDTFSLVQLHIVLR